MQYVIIGAGPTGLGAAYRLQNLGISDYAVFERQNQPGGLAASFTDPRGFIWDFGVHVMHSHYPEVDRLLQTVLPDGYLNHERRAWILSDKTYVPYPFQYNFHRLPQEACWDCLRGLLQAERDNGAAAASESFEQWMLAVFGKGIVRHFMAPYNLKMWRTALSEMSRAWVGERVARPEFERVLRNVLFQSDDVAWGPNHSFIFPRQGGTGAIWKALARQLPPEKLNYRHDLTAVDPQARKVHFKNGRSETYRYLISTIPLPELARHSGQTNLMQTAGRLRHTRVNVLGVGLPAPMPATLNDISWLYCADDRTDFYRLTPFSPYAPALTPDSQKWISLMCESSAPGSAPKPDLQTQAARTLEGLQSLNLIMPGGPPTHTFPMTAEYGYPVPTLDRDALLNRLQSDLETIDIYSRGRFGGWKYEVSNMDHCLMQGIEIIDRLERGQPELTLPFPGRINTAGARR